MLIKHLLIQKNIMMSWTYDRFIKWINNGCNEKVTHVTKLVFQNNNLKTIPKQIKHFINLTHFTCFNNKLKSLPIELFSLINLTHLSLSNNKLEEISPDIGHLANLVYFNCMNNELTSLPSEITHLVNLVELHCSHNELTELPNNMNNLTNLVILNCSHNKITRFHQNLAQLTNMTQFIHNNNPVEIIHNEVVNMLNNARNINNYGTHGIYNDRESVHNHNIQNGVRNAVSYILSNIPTICEEELVVLIKKNTILSTLSKGIILNFLNINEIHCVFGITFKKIFLHVFSMILNHKYSSDILKILDNDMIEARYKCFTGRVSRLVNCLSGFDENIMIGISETEQIANVIIMFKNKLEQKNQYDVDTMKKLVTKELISRNINQELINIWIDQIE